MKTTHILGLCLAFAVCAVADQPSASKVIVRTGGHAVAEFSITNAYKISITGNGLGTFDQATGRSITTGGATLEIVSRSGEKPVVITADEIEIQRKP